MDITLKRLNKIFSIAFEEDIELTLDGSKETINNWDSINHLNLIIELEAEFNISFLPEEIEKMSTVSNIIKTIKSKL